MQTMRGITNVGLECKGGHIVGPSEGICTCCHTLHNATTSYTTRIMHIATHFSFDTNN